MTNTLLLSPFDKSIFWHGGESYIILGIIGVLLGLLVGWLAWRKCGEQANSIERSNEELGRIHKQLQMKQKELNSMIEEL